MDFARKTVARVADNAKKAYAEAQALGIEHGTPEYWEIAAKYGLRKPTPTISEKLVGGVGTALKYGSALIPGVGIPAAIALGAGGGILSNADDEDGFDGWERDALGGAVVGGAGAVAKGALSGGSAATGGAGATSTLPIGAAANASTLDKVLGIGSKVGKTLLDNKELALGAVGLYQGAKEKAAADKTRQQATDMALADKTSRDKIVQQLLGAQRVRPDLSKVFADPGNPYR